MIIKNDEEVLLHENLHSSMDDSLEFKAYFNRSRLKIFPYVEEILGREISGSVLDVGAGNGYAGIWLAKNRKVGLLSLECTNEATLNIIPGYAKKFGVADVVKVENGSFYDLSPHSDEFDFVVCFGVLHHASNLLLVLDNIHKTLKPGAILIAQEPFTKNKVSNHVFSEIYDSREEFAGKIIRHGDRDDHFYRKCEYQTAIHHSGFNIVHDQDVTNLINNSSLISRFRPVAHKVWLKINRKLKNIDAQEGESFAEMRGRRLQPRHRLWICQKPPGDSQQPPHRWCK